MSAETFYADLPSLENFLDITDFRNFVSVPQDWLIIVTDIAGSTKAIESGRYKDVNLMGAASIVAILNIAKNIDIPFVFGGDGATILIPPTLLSAVQGALLATQDLAQNEFDFDLRIGIVPVSVVIERHYDVKVAKVKISENYTQAVFTGGGLAYANDLVKNATTAGLYRLNNVVGSSQADFSGLECRWQDIPSKHGEIVSLLVMAISDDLGEISSVYKDVLHLIKEIYGEEADLHPVSAEYLNLSFNENKLFKEVKIRSQSGSWLDKEIYLSKIKLANYLGAFFMGFKVKTRDTDWGNYKQSLITATDYKKFDDMLRMVIAGNTLQSEKLTKSLDNLYKEGKLVYGLHISDRAIMTCLVFERNGRQVHFVDGADGGYALAAKAMKSRMKSGFY
ncbi:DUF3095 domain-containing protein [Aerosakkonema sp. BLCC-F183]|uniref:DUF3095 domain-containing protein n=1 Tax=Aerosakkonema sp. BLCC-F183 TaxID=3342834 RepID=UPI0035BABD78